MNKKYKLIIFDLIDTLANSESIFESTKILEQEVGSEMVDFIIGGGKLTQKNLSMMLLLVSKILKIFLINKRKLYGTGLSQAEQFCWMIP